MIPALVVPVINHPELLAQMVASIDHPVGTLLIIDNSPELGMGDVADESLTESVHSLVVTEPPSNLGVAASWNLGIRSFPDDWVLIANADLSFAPGDLARLDDAMDGQHIYQLAEWAAFGIPPAVVERVGWFDENFHPIYFEDTDYAYRCGLEGVSVTPVWSGVTHAGSVSYRGNHHAADNARTFPANADYYRRKWGGGRGQERFATPFDSALPTWAWRLEPSRLSAQRWDR